MKEYDIIVIGSGAGLSIVQRAVAEKKSVALIDKGPAGGTCLNTGCIPSKILLAAADRIMEIKGSDKFGIASRVDNINFASLMDYMREYVNSGHDNIYGYLKNSKNIDYYQGTGRFVDSYTLKVDDHKLKAKQIFIVTGARPVIPPIEGLKNIDYLTNQNLHELKRLPERLTIVGGGYIAVEYAHFFEAMGTKVSIIQRNDRLVPGLEPEISERLEKELGRRMSVYTGYEAEKVEKRDEGVITVLKGKGSGTHKKLLSDNILIAAGRKSNADILKAENAGIELDENSYIKVDKYFMTSVKNIWAFGDALGKAMFTHVSRRQAGVVWRNAIKGTSGTFDFGSVPYAVFTYPNIASVGLTEGEAKKGHSIMVGRADYTETAKGYALHEKNNFAKAIIEKDTKRILGFHIIGANAPTLLQPVTNAIAHKGDINFLAKGMYIHPALSELIPAAFKNLKEV